MTQKIAVVASHTNTETPLGCTRCDRQQPQGRITRRGLDWPRGLDRKVAKHGPSRVWTTACRWTRARARTRGGWLLGEEMWCAWVDAPQPLVFGKPCVCWLELGELGTQQCGSVDGLACLDDRGKRVSSFAKTTASCWDCVTLFLFSLHELGQLCIASRRASPRTTHHTAQTQPPSFHAGTWLVHAASRRHRTLSCSLVPSPRSRRQSLVPCQPTNHPGPLELTFSPPRGRPRLPYAPHRSSGPLLERKEEGCAKETNRSPRRPILPPPALRCRCNPSLP